MPQSEAQEPDNESKSQRKRDMLALQKMGESLIKLSAEQLAKMNLPDTLVTAIQHMKSLSSHGAQRRQLQYIGKIMRHIEPETIEQALKTKELIHEKGTAKFHLLEEWRNKLLLDGDVALNSFLIDYPNADRQQLRLLVRNAQRDRKNEKNTGAEKVLFKFLHSIVENL